jgi:molybdopterin-guanine dinucleotide biosynthesis protein A
VTAAGIVLAGGDSRRMGGPKALAEWHGVPLVAHVAAIVASVVSPVVVVRDPGLALPPLPAGVEVANDEVADRGPLEGMAAGLRSLAGRAGVVFVAAVDMPLLHPAFIEQIVAALDGVDAAVPVLAGRAHPLAAAYGAGVLPTVERRLAAGLLRATGLLDDVRVRYLADADLVHPESLRNANTPAELERLATGRMC